MLLETNKMGVGTEVRLNLHGQKVSDMKSAAVLTADYVLTHK